MKPLMHLIDSSPMHASWLRCESLTYLDRPITLNDSPKKVFTDNGTRTHLKKVFWPNLGVSAGSQILDILQYACGLKPGPAYTLDQNPFFEIGSTLVQLLHLCWKIMWRSRIQKLKQEIDSNVNKKSFDGNEVDVLRSQRPSASAIHTFIDSNRMISLQWSNTNPNVAKVGGRKSQGAKGEAVVCHCEPLATPDLASSGFPGG
jgi:hypothetical protein